ncbi:hypothetical protein GC163_14330 [bacterium]|nr:hypothetical protein [bacterium]
MWKPWKRWSLILVALFVAYLASSGPMYWLAMRGYFGKGPIFFLSYVYAPLWWFTNPEYQRWLNWWLDLGDDH